MKNIFKGTIINIKKNEVEVYLKGRGRAFNTKCDRNHFPYPKEIYTGMYFNVISVKGKIKLVPFIKKRFSSKEIQAIQKNISTVVEN